MSSRGQQGFRWKTPHRCVQCEHCQHHKALRDCDRRQGLNFIADVKELCIHLRRQCTETFHLVLEAKNAIREDETQDTTRIQLTGHRSHYQVRNGLAILQYVYAIQRNIRHEAALAVLIESIKQSYERPRRNRDRRCATADTLTMQ